MTFCPPRLVAALILASSVVVVRASLSAYGQAVAEHGQQKYADARQTLGAAEAAQGQFMALSPDKTHLVNTFTNQPVFITGDTAYALAVQLSSNSDIEAYFSNRQAKGINLIWAALVDAGYHADAKTENDAAGNNPWSGGADFTGMVSATAYWDHVDYVLRRAAAHGITILAGTGFTATFHNCNSSYYASMASTSDATLTAYGQFLGDRYKSYPNIIWLMGGTPT